MASLTPRNGRRPRKSVGRGVDSESVPSEPDYNGMPLEAWKAALKKDVETRFGPTPNDLVQAGKSGW